MINNKNNANQLTKRNKKNTKKPKKLTKFETRSDIINKIVVKTGLTPLDRRFETIYLNYINSDKK